MARQNLPCVPGRDRTGEPPDFQSGALPAELQTHAEWTSRVTNQYGLAASAYETDL